MKLKFIKKCFRYATLSVVMSSLLCVGCGKNAEEVETDFRVLITSDMHCTTIQDWYGVSNEDRMQLWVDSILKEHAEHPIDLIIIPGDTSLDHWISGGTYRKDGISTTKVFMDNYVSQLPEGVPVITLPGNHEQYGNEEWKAITGNDRQCSYVLGKNLFIMPDSYGANLNPNYDHDGEYTQMDMEYINKQMKEYPEHNVYIISHYIDIQEESQEFKDLVAKNDNVKGLFAGHTHKNSLINLGTYYKDKVIAQTGNFSYTNELDVEKNFWGFRDLVITAEGATSSYILAECDAVIDSVPVHMERKLINVVEYK